MECPETIVRVVQPPSELGQSNHPTVSAPRIHTRLVAAPSSRRGSPAPAARGRHQPRVDPRSTDRRMVPVAQLAGWLHHSDDRLRALHGADVLLSLIHISEPTRRTPISYAV